MTTTKRVIAWEKWKDPWSKDEEKEEKDCWEDRGCDLEELDFDTNYETEEEGRIIITPMGAIPLLNHNSPGKVFNLWIGHTNFKISEAVVKTIDETLGVESLDVYTPYRMRVGIGKLFKPQDVMRSIDTQLNKLFHRKNKNGSTKKKHVSTE